MPADDPRVAVVMTAFLRWVATRGGHRAAVPVGPGADGAGSTGAPPPTGSPRAGASPHEPPCRRVAGHEAPGHGENQGAIGDDPAQAVGSAKELIESTAKTVLIERGQPVNDKDDIAALIRKAQQSLSLHPSAATPGPDGSDAVKRILGSLTGVAIGVAELCNRGYGTGHGAAGPRVGLRARHAHLAVNAAITWCHLMLDTLADTNAPWRTTKASA